MGLISLISLICLMSPISPISPIPPIPLISLISPISPISPSAFPFPFPLLPPHKTPLFQLPIFNFLRVILIFAKIVIHLYVGRGVTALGWGIHG